MSTPRFFTKTLKLDEVFTRSQQNGHHWAGSTVRAVKVIETNNENFKLDFVPDPFEGHIEGLPLGDIRTHNLETTAQNAVFENKISQPDVWVTVLFTTEDRLDGTSANKSGGGSEALIVGGSTFDNDKFEVSPAGLMLLNADDNRASATIYNQSEASVYIGTEAKINAADFADRCIKIAPGKSLKWDLPDALFARTDAAASVYPVILNKAKS